jgi:hypothetical protein
MRILLLIALLLVPAVAPAKVVNAEFKFTPYVGDTKDDSVDVVAGTARVFLNGVPVAEQEVEKHEVPVVFEAREIAPAVWVTAESLGPLVRKGKNTIRFEFVPADATVAYKARLQFASVSDQKKETREPGRLTATNQAQEAAQEQAGTGPIAMTHEFTADFATDQPWHHLPPVTSLTDEDKHALAALVAERATWFAPDFTSIYKALAGTPHVDLAEIRKRKCLEAAHKAGVHVTAVPESGLDFVTPGGPEVVVRGKRGELYPPDRAAFERIKGDDMQTCAGMALARVYPKQLVVVRTPGGTWVAVQ